MIIRMAAHESGLFFTVDTLAQVVRGYESSPMKNIVPVLLLLCGLSLAGSVDKEYYGEAPCPNGSTPGRFALCFGKVSFERGGEEYSEFMRIDTATGQVWEYTMSPIGAIGDQGSKRTVWGNVWRPTNEEGGKIDGNISSWARGQLAK